MLDITYPNAAKIIDSFGKISKVLLEETRVNEFISKISKTPIKPIIIEINFRNENLSSFVKKCENTKVNIGAIDNNKPAVFDCM